jgi:hypothetical protein
MAEIEIAARRSGRRVDLPERVNHFIMACSPLTGQQDEISKMWIDHAVKD